eukprot:TRINITY_DN27902_c0_g1_i1.p1 TRINITY_DN27902_c0_g1~~TRINITY_DN27902_c0_g1_i1.p1  ORF type:complete len:831 (-),score=175.36 TRINITY_DN27902_c0_g1_i1:74-2566(-)
MTQDSLDGVALDETLKVDTAAVAEDAVLARLESYREDIQLLQNELSQVQQPGSTLADLRALVESAAKLQAKSGLPDHLLTKETLKQAGVPAEELEQARRLVVAVNNCEQAALRGRQRLEQNPQLGSALEDLRQLLSSWEDLRKLERKVKKEELRSPFSVVDLGTERRCQSLAPLCEALLEEVESSGSSDDKQQLVSFHAQSWFRQALESLNIKVPGRPNQGSASRSRSSSQPRAPQSAGTSSFEQQAAAVAAAARAAEEAVAAAAAAEAAVARSRSPTPPPGVRRPGVAERELPGKPQSQLPGLESNVTFAGVGLSSFVQSQREELQRHRREREGGQEQQAEDTLGSFTFSRIERHSASETQNVLERQASVPGRGTVPHQQAPPETQHVPQRQASFQKQAAAQDHLFSRGGSPKLWHAVHVGDQATLGQLIKLGACNGGMKDASGHSVLWHAIAFGHLGIAKLMLDSFPSGTVGGVDVGEVHPRRKDTLLHLLCQTRPFGPETAGLFKRICEPMPDFVFRAVNGAGHCFLTLAVVSLNFWILKFVTLSYPQHMKALVCSADAPLLRLAEFMPQPSRPVCMAAEKIPEHFAVSSLLSQGATGHVPFADVAFDVGPMEDDAGDAKGRFLAHRVVVGAQSPVFLRELEFMPAETLVTEGISARVFRVDPRISKHVWRSVLQFLYTGVVHCPFTNDPALMVELFRAAAVYRLPKALLDVAQASLFQLLPASPPDLSLQVFSITAGSSGEGLEVEALRELSTLILLRSGHQIFEIQDMQPKDFSTIMDSIFQTVEQAVCKASSNMQAAQQHQRPNSFHNGQGYTAHGQAAPWTNH